MSYNRAGTMRFFVAVTDFKWYSFLSCKPSLDEVNFWRPSALPFRALAPGELFLFKLHAPHNQIAGGGFFVAYLTMPLQFVWEVFGEKNGAATLDEFGQAIAKYRREEYHPWHNPEIGCILLTEPFFFSRSEWIACPPDFASNIVTGKTYDSSEPIGRRLWNDVQDRLQRQLRRHHEDRPATVSVMHSGVQVSSAAPSLELGPGLFRTLVTEAYSRRCAVSGEVALPALEVTRIRRLASGRGYELRNGILLRSDLRRLWDAGYIAVEPRTLRLLVSRRIQEEFGHGSSYYALEGRFISQPSDEAARPPHDYWASHYEAVFH